jgi:hypothetical protein
MVHHRNWIILAAVGFTLIAFLPPAQAEPPLIEGNPGLPGCLAKVDQLEQLIGALQEQVNTLQALLDTMQDYAPVPQTGQTVSYLSGDDGNLQMGAPWPTPRLTDNGDGTVTDNLTGLMWTKSANLYGATNWSEALTSCNSCSEGYYTGWRLPNVRELHSLLNYGGPQYSMLPADHPFIGLPASPTWYYWSSSTHGSAESAWVMSFENGWMHTAGAISFYGVWCVRGPVPFQE